MTELASLLKIHINIGIALTPSYVHLTRSGDASSPLVKFSHYWYMSRILDAHKSNRFGPSKFSTADALPDTWLPREVLHSRYQYTKRRDIWCLGVITLQMIYGLNVITDFPQPSSALASCMSLLSIAI
jgi:hypothetical protein